VIAHVAGVPVEEILPSLGAAASLLAARAWLSRHLARANDQLVLAPNRRAHEHLDAPVRLTQPVAHALTVEAHALHARRMGQRVADHEAAQRDSRSDGGDVA
jgi:hypothetical protein